MNKQQVLAKIERAWTAFGDSFAGLSDSDMTGPRVTRVWTVKDIVAHVTWWEEEALKYLPAVAAGERTPKYLDMYGGMDAFNALMTEERRSWPLAQVLSRAEEVHARLVDYVASADDALLDTDTRFRKRLRLDTYGHYPIHAKVIAAWRAGRVG